MEEQQTVVFDMKDVAPPTSNPVQVFRYVTVQTGEDTYEKFPDAIALVRTDGTLIIVHWRDPRGVPAKGFAPGRWRTFEHMGDYTPPSSRPRPLRPLGPPAEPFMAAARAESRAALPPRVSGRTYEMQLSEIGSDTARPARPRPVIVDAQDDPPRRFGRWFGR